MKKLLNSNQNTSAVDIALLVLRIGIAGMMLTHGIPKMQQLFSGEEVQFLPFAGLSPTISLSLTVFAEVVCSIFILIGFGTRIAVVPLIFTMLVALFAVHAGDPFGKQEPAFHYLLVYVGLLIAGSGKYSVDRLLGRETVGQKRRDVVMG